MRNIRSFENGLRIEQRGSTAIDTVGEVEVVSGKLRFHDGSSAVEMTSNSQTQTLTNKTLTSPIITGATISGSTISLDDSDSAFVLALQSTSTLTANRTLTFDTNDGSRTIELSGNITIAGNLTTAGALITSGANSLTLTTTGATNVTLPTTGILSTLAGSETLTNKTLTSPTITGATLSLDDTDSAFALSVASTSTLTQARALTLDVNDADRTIDISGNITLAGALTTAGALITSGANSLTLTTTGATNVTLPTTGTLATLAGSEALTNKTLTSPIITGATITGSTITLDDSDSAFTLGLVSTSTLSANRILTLDVNDAARTIELSGNITLAGNLTTAGALITSGANSLTLTTTGATNVTLPTTGTLATLAGSEIFTNKTISRATNTLSGFTASAVAVADGSGNLTSEAQLALVRGGAAIDNSQTDDNVTTGADATLNAVTGHVRATNGSLTSLTMIPAAAAGGVEFTWYNDTGNDVDVRNQNGGTAANRIITGTGADITVTSGSTLQFVYDGTEQRWLIVGGTGSGAPFVGATVSTAGEQGSVPAPAAGEQYYYLKGIGDWEPSEIINYIGNGRAMDTTVGWATYADAAGTSPVNGTGGSPNVTWTLGGVNTDLRNSSSFLFTKDAANRQGEGVSYDFTLENADRASVLTISFEYIVKSGTFNAGTSSTDSDLTVWLYDVTNGVVIQPLDYKLYSNSTSIAGKYVAQFQTDSTSTSYRFILHNGTTNASAYTVRFDTFVVGPQIQTRGVISYTKTFTPTGTWIANTTYTGVYKRVGDHASVYIQLALAGAPTSATLQVDLPFTIDTTKLPGGGFAGELIGHVRVFDDSGATGSEYLQGQASYVDSNTIQVEVIDDAAASNHWQQAVTQAVPVTFAANDKIWIHLPEIPVLGWESNTQISSDSGTRVVEFSAVDDAPTSAAFAGASNLIFPSNSDILRDTHAAYNATTGVYTIPETGYYRIAGQTNISGTEAANDLIALGVYKNSTLVKSGRTRVQATTLTDNPVSVYHEDLFTAGDTVALRITTAMTGAGVATLASAHSFSVGKIQTPQSIGMADVVAASYTTNSGQGFANTTLTIVNFEDIDYDTHNAVVVGAGVWAFTAPLPGLYQVNSAIQFGGTGAFDEGEGSIYDLYKNGSLYRRVDNYQMQASPASAAVINRCSCLVKMNTGDTLNLRVTQDAGDTRTLTATGSSNWITIQRIG